ncbi:MAG TPA: ribonuclease III [Bacteroidales bacterium]|nr:ribonuclease III [Bacteroidales bacterium]
MRFLSVLSKNKNTSEFKIRQAIKAILGFYPKNLTVYQLAFRHRSVAASLGNGFKNSNERLEYLGDAVLGSIVADFLFKKFPYKDEGFLTEMRSRIVSRASLNILSRKLGIDDLVQTSQESSTVASSILGDAFEALVGAIYIDKGYKFTRKIIVNQIIACHLDIDAMLNTEINFKSKIIEWSQKERKQVEFVMVDELENGTKNRRLYVVHLLIDGVLTGKGHDYSIKKAEQKAAEQAWKLLADKIPAEE